MLVYQRVSQQTSQKIGRPKQQPEAAIFANHPNTGVHGIPNNNMVLIMVYYNITGVCIYIYNKPVSLSILLCIYIYIVFFPEGLGLPYYHDFVHSHSVFALSEAA